MIDVLKVEGYLEETGKGCSIRELGDNKFIKGHCKGVLNLIIRVI